MTWLNYVRYAFKERGHFLLSGFETTTDQIQPAEISKEKILIKHLLDKYHFYGRVGRPVTNTSDIITVEFGLSLIQIMNVDEKNQVLETNVWYTYVSRNCLVHFCGQHTKQGTTPRTLVLYESSRSTLIWTKTFTARPNLIQTPETLMM